ncbi:hypothetical protein [Sphingomonas sp. SRS2]|uniref:hypothetical protein n=1 Tax=Sphingomonas sp. SRS2 TaxID=133190 RepID=UPI0006184301|nr:hypothetical protein [Sphingomonas sp. SRS2]KKC27320.1 hypothetical protein WP12_04015 [Sphingomonas sp. SRS2]
MADRYAHGFRSAISPARRELHDMADQYDNRTPDECSSGKPPSMAVQKLHLAAQRVGALQPIRKQSPSGVPITKKEALA